MPHYFIDGKGPWFKAMELEKWFHENLVQARGTTKVADPQITDEPSQSAPSSIAKLYGLVRFGKDSTVITGVYFLCDGDEVVYVGQSTNIPARIGTHIHHRARTFDHDRVFCLGVPRGHLDRVEAELIDQLRPKYNRVMALRASDQ